MRFFVFLAAFVVCAFRLANGQGPATLSLDHVDGVTGGTLDMGVPVTFYIRVTGDDTTHFGITNGFRVYSPDGAVWDTTIADTTGTLGKTQFDGGFFLNAFSTDGSGADTVGFGGFSIFSTGMPAGFDDIAYTIEIGPIDASNGGRTICLDSAYYPPAGVWKWASPTVLPGWDGPHCFRVTCCISPIRGNVDYDIADLIDIADLVYLVDYMFNGEPAPPCVEEGNVDGSCCVNPPDETLDDIEIADLVYLVDYMFNGGPEPPGC